MNRLISICTIIMFFFSTLGCATSGQKGKPSAGESAGLGAMMGAVGGALVGLVTGGGKGAVKGALIGAAVGGITGFVVGKYRENQYKTAQQVYKENPAYAKPEAKSKPAIATNIQPYIVDSRGRKVTTVKNGEKVELSMKYDIVVPQYSDTKQVKVEECNTLVNSKGKEMDRSKLTRKKTRTVGGIDAMQEVTITENLPDGKYTHLAIVKIGNKEYKKKQEIQIASSEIETKIYAVNMNR